MQGPVRGLSAFTALRRCVEYLAFDQLKNSKASSAILRVIWPPVATAGSE
jgi:hypothetical protein